MGGHIDFEEFLDAITSKLGDKETKSGISKIFALFDDDKTGTISLKNLKRVAKELGETMTDEELREMIERADSDGDGEISVADYYEEDLPVSSFVEPAAKLAVMRPCVPPMPSFVRFSLERPSGTVHIRSKEVRRIRGGVRLEIWRAS